MSDGSLTPIICVSTHDFVHSSRHTLLGRVPFASLLVYVVVRGIVFKLAYADFRVRNCAGRYQRVDGCFTS